MKNLFSKISERICLVDLKKQQSFKVGRIVFKLQGVINKHCLEFWTEILATFTQMCQGTRTCILKIAWRMRREQDLILASAVLVGSEPSSPRSFELLDYLSNYSIFVVSNKK